MTPRGNTRCRRSQVAVGLLCLGLVWTRAVSAGSEIIHVVQRGDTLGRLAEQYGVSLQDIIAANNLTNPDLIVAGQQLLVPVLWSPDQVMLSEHIRGLDVSTVAPVQGKTWSVVVTSTLPLTVSGTFDGHVLHWVVDPLTNQDGWRYWSLVGVHPLTPPGMRDLVIQTMDQRGEGWKVNGEMLVRPGEFETYRLYLPAEVSQLLDPELVQREQELLAQIWSQSAAQPTWRGMFQSPIHPVWQVSSPYGQRRAYNDGPVSSYHAGTDYGAKQGALVRAPAAGRVVLADGLQVRGNAVILDHGGGLHSGYWHLSEILVREGEEVDPGDLLGRVGNTGLSTGAHLHWEIRVGDVAVDPLQWLDEHLPVQPMLK